MCLVLKREQRQTKLTTALWYWQHCYWHHNWELLKLYRWHQQTIATALFYSGEQHQEMSLDRIFDMARSFAGKTVLSSNFLQHRKIVVYFSKLEPFWMFVDRNPFPTGYQLPILWLALTKGEFQDIGHILPIGPKLNRGGFSNCVLFRNPKRKFSSVFPGLISSTGCSASQWCHRGAPRTLTAVSNAMFAT